MPATLRKHGLCLDVDGEADMQWVLASVVMDWIYGGRISARAATLRACPVSRAGARCSRHAL